MQYRHGDILLARIERLPKRVRRMHAPILASSNTTGHQHKIRDKKSAVLYINLEPFPTEMVLHVIAPQAELIHPEHDTIVLEQGYYRVWHQREFGDLANRQVAD